MTIYDGSTFGAIDANAYADPCPFDEWLARKTENNVAHLYVTDPPVSVYRRGGAALSNSTTNYYGDRAICGVARSAFIAVPVWLDESVESVTISILARTNYDAVSIGGQVVMGPASTVVGVLDVADFKQHFDYNDIGLTDFVIPVRVSSPGWGIAFLTIQSKTIDDVSSKKSVTYASADAASTTQIALDFGASYVYTPAEAPDPVVANPNQTVFDHCAVENIDAAANGDLVSFAFTGAAGVHVLQSTVPIVPVVVATGDVYLYLGLRPLSYLQLRSWIVQIRRKYDIRSAELMAGKLPRGVDESRRAQITSLLRGRRRMVAAGPTGYQPPSPGITQGDHPSIFNFAIGASTNPQPTTTILRATTPDVYEDGEIEIVLVLFGNCSQADGIGSLDWDLDVTVSNFTNVSSVSGTYPIQTMGTDSYGGFSPDTARSSSSDTSWLPRIANSRLSAYADLYAVKDGQFLPHELNTMTTVVIRVPVPAGGSVNAHDIQVNATCAGNMQGITQSRGNLYRYCSIQLVAWSIYAVPEVG